MHGRVTQIGQKLEFGHDPQDEELKFELELLEEEFTELQ